MYALTIRQPWAGIIAEGRKAIEFRSGRAVSMVGERIAIYAGAKRPTGGHFACGPSGAALKCVVATAILSECRSSSRLTDSHVLGYQPEAYAWVLDDVQALDPPVPATPPRGAQVWWHLPPAITWELMSQLSAYREPATDAPGLGDGAGEDETG